MREMRLLYITAFYSFLAISIHFSVEKLLGLCALCQRNCSALHWAMEAEWCYLPLDRGANSAVNDELGQHTNSTRDTEEDSVVVGLSQAIVLE